MKIVKSSLKQTSLTCPSAWSGQTDEGQDLVISFRTGRLELKVDGRTAGRGERDGFDVSSYMELEEALAILRKEGFECE